MTEKMLILFLCKLLILLQSQLNFCPLEESKAFHCCPFRDLLANFWNHLMIDFKKREKNLSILILKLESLSEQNADPALWQIADPYIGSAEFFSIGKIKSFHCCPFLDLLANFWTYLMFVFKIWLQGWEVGLDGGNPRGQVASPWSPFLLLDWQNFALSWSKHGPLQI